MQAPSTGNKAMETFTRVDRDFSGRHRIKGDKRCGGDCGHTWQVTVTASDADLRGIAFDEVAYVQAIDAICWELDGRDIDNMIAPAVSTPQGIAYWIAERLGSKYVIEEVEVWLEHRKEGAVLRLR